MPEPRRFHAAYLETRFRTPAMVSRWPDRFVILSAFATTGETWTDERNDAADQALGRELRGRGWLARIVGYSPSSGHAEPSWAVEMPIRQAREVGSRFKQDAIFAVRGNRLRVIRCGESCLSAVVGSFLERLDGEAKNVHDGSSTTA